MLRTQYLDQHFKVLEEVLKAQFKVEEFDQFAQPITDCVRVVGRVVNLSEDDGKLNESCVGLINISNEVPRVKLNLQQV